MDTGPGRYDGQGWEEYVREKICSKDAHAFKKTWICDGSLQLNILILNNFLNNDSAYLSKSFWCSQWSPCNGEQCLAVVLVLPTKISKDKQISAIIIKWEAGPSGQKKNHTDGRGLFLSWCSIGARINLLGRVSTLLWGGPLQYYLIWICCECRNQLGASSK